MGCARAIIAKLKSYAAALKNNDKRPLLDMCPGERREIILYNGIQGFAYVSALPGAVESGIDALNTAHIISSAGAAATFVPVSSLLGLSAIGTAAGIYFAHKEVVDENERIIRLNKELFILFNIAADRWEEYQRLMQSTAPDKQRLIADGDRKYQEAILEIQKAILSDDANTADVLLNASPSAKVGDENSILSDAVKAYVRRRESPHGADEQALWIRLKDKKNIFRGDDKPIENFIKHSSEKQIKEFFDNENKIQAKIYQKKRSELEEKILSEIKDTSQITEELAALRSILETICEPNVAHEAAITNIDQANAACSAIMEKLPDSQKTNFYTMWGDLRRQIARRNDHWVHAFDETSRQIVNDTHKIFGELGSFREFWRGPDRKQPYENEECIPHNLDQMIHRGGAKLEAKVIAEKSFLTAASLYSTGQGLYFAAVAFGAVAMSSTVVGLIVMAVAISLTLLCIACYMRTQKMQRDRGAIVGRFELARKLLVADEVKNSSQIVQNREMKDADVLHREEKEAQPQLPPFAGSPRMRPSGSVAA